MKYKKKHFTHHLPLSEFSLKLISFYILLLRRKLLKNVRTFVQILFVYSVAHLVVPNGDNEVASYDCDSLNVTQDKQTLCPRVCTGMQKLMLQIVHFYHQCYKLKMRQWNMKIPPFLWLLQSHYLSSISLLQII